MERLAKEAISLCRVEIVLNLANRVSTWGKGKKEVEFASFFIQENLSLSDIKQKQ